MYALHAVRTNLRREANTPVAGTGPVLIQRSTAYPVCTCLLLLAGFLRKILQSISRLVINAAEFEHEAQEKSE